MIKEVSACAIALQLVFGFDTVQASFGEHFFEMIKKLPENNPDKKRLIKGNKFLPIDACCFYHLKNDKANFSMVKEAYLGVTIHIKKLKNEV